MRALLVDLQIKLMGKGNALPIQQCFRTRDPRCRHGPNWTFASSDDGGRRAGAVYTLIQTAKY
jgi:hypothetical protein